VARRHFAAAVEVLGALGYAYSLAQVRADLGMLLMADGDVEQARGELDEAIATFGRLRAGPALERTESVLARLPVAARSG
jgi:hypothetical protein